MVILNGHGRLAVQMTNYHSLFSLKSFSYVFYEKNTNNWKWPMVVTIKHWQEVSSCNICILFYFWMAYILIFFSCAITNKIVLISSEVNIELNCLAFYQKVPHFTDIPSQLETTVTLMVNCKCDTNLATAINVDTHDYKM